MHCPGYDRLFLGVKSLMSAATPSVVWYGFVMTGVREKSGSDSPAIR